MGQARVVVIGAGIAGLTAALRLAHAGHDVTVLERAQTPGGKMRSVDVGGLAVEAGPTVFTMRWVLDELFAECGARLDAHVALAPASLLARHAWSATERLDLHADIDASADAIEVFAGPREAEGYRRFCARSAEVYRTLEGPFIRGGRTGPAGLAQRVGLSGLGDLWRIQPFATLWSALGDFFEDPRLLQLFGRYATYCGASPFTAPATLMLVAHVEQAGVWTVAGGLSALAKAVADLAAARGARFRYGAHVEGICVAGGRVEGVQLAGGERVPADIVVCNADAAALAAGLFGTEAAHVGDRVATAERSLSAVTVCLTARPKGFPLAHHTVFFSADYRAEFDALQGARRLPEDPTVYVCAQDRTVEGSAPEGPERLLMLVNAPADGRERPLTPQEIARCERTLSARLEACGLTLADASDPVETTPSGFEALFPGTGGALYGRASQGWAATFKRQGARTRLSGLYLAGGSVHPGPGVPMAAQSGRLAAAAILADLDFDGPVARGGYAWWYVDAVSDDGRHGLTIIAFIGSVFSPYYAWSADRNPFAHCAMNVVLYGDENRFAMTERGAKSLSRGADHIAIGPSAMAWDGTALTVRIDECGAPLPRRIRGTVRLVPSGITAGPFHLDPAGRHRWWPMAPSARVAVDLDAPSLRWSGGGYFDTNDGDEPLEAAFSRWTWCRADLSDGAAILYDVHHRNGGGRNLSLRFHADGARRDIRPPLPAALPPTRLWRMPRETRSDDARARVLRTFEDTPFYSRSLLASTLDGEPVRAVHESLSLDRFRNPLVRLMLPFRMPRPPATARS